MNKTHLNCPRCKTEKLYSVKGIVGSSLWCKKCGYLEDLGNAFCEYCGRQQRVRFKGNGNVECFKCGREFKQLPKELEDIMKDNLAYAKRQRLIERIGKVYAPETKIPKEIKEMLRHNERLRKILGSQLDFLDKWIDLMSRLEEWNKAEEERRKKFTPKKYLKEN